MQKCNRRKAILILLSGAGYLGGCSTLSGYRPALPESCVWLKFPYAWMCIDPREGEDVHKAPSGVIPDGSRQAGDEARGSSPTETSELSWSWLAFPYWEGLASTDRDTQVICP